MTSVREALNIVGQAVSIKELAHQRGASFPLSVRNFVGALPPGRLRRKVISLDLLRRKFDQFVNERPQPLFKVRLHNIGSGDHRHSTVDVLLLDPVKGELSQLTDGQPKDLGQLEVDIPGPNPDCYFSDVNSRAFTIELVPGQPVALEAGIFFEADGLEMIVNNFPDIGFDSFNIRVKFLLEHDPTTGLVNLKTDKTLIKTDVSVDVAGLPDGVFASGIEKKFNSKIAEALEENRTAFNTLLTRWLVGGDFYVTGVSSDDQSLVIDYLIPPGQLEPFPENPQPPLDPGRLMNIDHIVVLMMENRSFDHMLGYLRKEGGRTDVDGLRGGEKNRYKGRDCPSFLLADTRFDESPPHGHEPVVNQIAGGNMEGFVAAFAAQYEARGVDPSKVMGYHNQVHLPVYDALAQQFMICQRWFAAHPGPTFCNRFYTVTGRLNRDAFGNFEFDNPHGDAFKPVPTRTLFDHLTEHGVSWHYYEHRYCFLRLFARYTTDDTYIVDALDPVKGFFASAQAGTLPAVSFIDPNFIDEPDGEDNDDGAPANIGAGQNLIGRVVNAVMQGPKWHKTLLVITYDEHGGFFDHVNPLKFRDKAIPVSGIDHYGVRVPTFVISPWVDKGVVSNVVFDHTSIAKTIARRFMSSDPPDMGARIAAANDLSLVLRATPRQDRPHIPVPPLPTRDLTLPKLTTSVAEKDDFKELMRTLHSRYRK